MVAEVGDIHMKNNNPPLMETRMIKTLVEIPSFPNAKDETRLKEEEKITQFIEKLLKPNDLVIDFGCGTSYYTSSNTSGLDLDVEMLKKADLENKVLANYCYVPFKNGAFNIVVMCHSLEHINDPSKPLKQAYRILQDKGKIIVSVPNLRGFFQLWKIIIRGIVQPCIGTDHLTAFTPKALKQFFRECGFKPIKESGDIVYFPGMKRLRLMRLGFWLANHFPSWANVYILVGERNA